MRSLIRFLVQSILFSVLFACTLTQVPPISLAAADLRFVADTARQTHPALSANGPTRQAFDLLAQALEAKTTATTTPPELYTLSSRLLASLHDGHSLMFPAKTEANLPVRFQWLVDGLVIAQAVESVGALPGDEVLKVGGITPAVLLEKLRAFIPAENDGHIRALGAWMLPNANILGALGAVQENAVTLELRKSNGDVVTNNLRLSSERPNVASRASFGWKLESNFGLFWLDSCDNTPEYRSALINFFGAVKNANLQNIALDLRQNSGGDSSVIDALLEFLPANSVQVFHRPERAGLVTVSHPKPELVFAGKIFVLTSPWTFSSANWIAGIFHDNQLGQLVGEATGNAPTSFGNVKSFTTPNFALRFQISQTLWIRPDISLDPANTLEPDVLIPATVNDARLGRDPILEWLKTR
jgi:C-terminal processing protease CtpA/Prc